MTTDEKIAKLRDGVGAVRRSHGSGNHSSDCSCILLRLALKIINELRAEREKLKMQLAGAAETLEAFMPPEEAAAIREEREKDREAMIKIEAWMNTGALLHRDRIMEALRERLS